MIVQAVRTEQKRGRKPDKPMAPGSEGSHCQDWQRATADATMTIDREQEYAFYRHRRVTSLIGRRARVASEIYEDHGVRFEYPSDWVVEVTDEDEVTTVDLQHPEGIAFVLVRIDESCSDPEETSDMALEAMREEYPELDDSPVIETLGEHVVTGHDVEFFALDVPNAAYIRCFRTPRRTVLCFGQWAELGGDGLSDIVRSVFRSLEELED
jgi:hypothetical protein